MDPRDAHDTIRAVSYDDGVLKLLDQRKLPLLEEYIECRNADDVAGGDPRSRRARRSGNRHRCRVGRGARSAPSA